MTGILLPENQVPTREKVEYEGTKDKPQDARTGRILMQKRVQFA